MFHTEMSLLDQRTHNYHSECENVIEESHIRTSSTDTFVISPSSTHNSSEFFSFGDILIADRFVYEDSITLANLTGTTSVDVNHDITELIHEDADRSNAFDNDCHLISTPNSASAVTKHLNDNITSWLLSESEYTKEKDNHTEVGNTCVADSYYQRKNYSRDDRRPYAIGDSNSKNAIAARDNRLKKKMYVAGLEESLKHLHDENEHLKIENQRNSNIISSLQREVSYLQRVIANESTLSAILTNIAKAPGINFSSMLKHSAQNENNYVNGTTSDSDNEIQKYVSNSSKSVSNSSKRHGNKSSSMRDAEEISMQLSVPGSDEDAAYSKASRRKTKHKSGNRNAYQKLKLGQNATIVVNSSIDSDLSATGTLISNDSNNNLSSGICLHVSGCSVSVEFCSHCSANANLGFLSDHSYVKS